MEERIAELRERIRELQERIREQERRIPPHSVQPVHLRELERLEEERDALQRELDSLEGSQS
jgi:prefoldin subunit 5